MGLAVHLRLCAAVLLLLTAHTSTCNHMNQEARQKIVLEYDLSESLATQVVGWKDENNNYLIKEGDISLTLKVPGGQVFKEDVTLFSFHRTDGQISSFEAHFAKQDTDHVYREARRLAVEWDLNVQALDAWYARRKKGEDELDERFETIRNDLRPPRALEILHSFNDEKPWYIHFSFGFIKLDS